VISKFAITFFILYRKQAYYKKTEKINKHCIIFVHKIANSNVKWIEVYH